MKNIYALLTAVITLTACSGLRSPSYTPSVYESYNCGQLQAELKLVSSRFDEKEAAFNQSYIAATTLTLMGVPQQGPNTRQAEQELKSLKDQREFLQHMLIRKDCAA